MIINVNDDLSAHIVTDDNTLECFLPNYNPETLIPFGSKEDVEAFAASITNSNYFQPYKTPKQHQEERERAAVALNVSRAKSALQDTDWCENASVRNTAVKPHLINPEAFDAYRQELRAIVINKPTTVDPWPNKPSAEWSN